jgi:hypothetical protein
MRWSTPTYLLAAEHVLRDPQPNDPPTDLALDAARAVLTNALVSANQAAGFYHVTAVAPPGVGRNLAAEMAPELRLNTGHQPPVTMLDGRTGVITAIDLAAGRLAGTPAHNSPSIVLVTASDAPQPHHASPAPSAGGALIVSRNDGALRLVSTTWRPDDQLQRLYDQNADADVIRERALEVITNAMCETFDHAWPDQDIDASDIDHMIVPASSEGIEREAFIDRLHGRPDAFTTVTDEKPPTDDLGSADLIVRLGTIDRGDDRLRSGEWVLIVAIDRANAATALLQVI